MTQMGIVSIITAADVTGATSALTIPYHVSIRVSDEYAGSVSVCPFGGSGGSIPPARFVTEHRVSSFTKEAVMPSIIAAPVRTRNDNRGMTEDQAVEYVTLMDEVAAGEIVLVDDSNTDGYEKSYAKGERVRNAIKKHGLDGDKKVKVIAFEQDGEFHAAVAWK
jgi:hypothetical protein